MAESISSLRMPDILKRRLRSAAGRNGVSVNSEILRRLVASFEAELAAELGVRMKYRDAVPIADVLEEAAAFLREREALSVSPQASTESQ